jgi:hypothetical protein
MRVRLNIGRRIGEVVEMEYATAKVMIADGRATDPRIIPGPDSDCAPAYSALQINTVSPAARKRRR